MKKPVDCDLDVIGEQFRDIIDVLNDVADFGYHGAFLFVEGSAQPTMSWYYIEGFGDIQANLLEKISDYKSCFAIAAREGKVVMEEKSTDSESAEIKETNNEEQGQNLWIPLFLGETVIGVLDIVALRGHQFPKYTINICDYIVQLGMKALVDGEVEDLWKRLRFCLLHRKTYLSAHPLIDEILAEYMERSSQLITRNQIRGTIRMIETASIPPILQSNLCELPSDNDTDANDLKNCLSLTFKAMKNIDEGIWENYFNTGITINPDSLTKWLSKIKNNLTKVTEDIDPTYTSYFNHKSPKSTFIAPSIYNDELIALFSFDSSKDDAFGDDTIKALLILATHAAPHIMNAQSRTDLIEERKWLAVLHELGMSISPVKHRRLKIGVEEIFIKSVESITRVCGADGANLILFNTNEPPENSLGVKHKQAYSYGLGEGYAIKVKPRSNGLTAKVIKSLKPLSVDNPDTEPGINDLAIKNGIQSYLCLPMMVQQKIIGVLFIHYKKAQAFSKNKLKTTTLFSRLSFLANLAASAIENARLTRSLTIQAKRLTSLHRDAAKNLSLEVRLARIIDFIIKGVVALVDADRSLFIMLDTKKKKLNKDRCGVYNYEPEYLSELTYEEVMEGVSGEVERSGKAKIIKNVQKYKKNSGRAKKNSIKHNTGPIIVVPLIVGGAIIGTLTAAKEKGKAPFSNDDLKLALMLADHAASAIRNFNFVATLQAYHKIFSDITKLAVSADGLKIVLKEIAKKAIDTLGIDVITIYEYDQKTGFKVPPPPIMRGIRKPKKMQTEVRTDQAPWVIVNKLNDHHYAPDAINDSIMRPQSEDPENENFVKREGIVSSAGLRLKADDRIVGVMFVNYRTFNPFMKNEKRIIETFASSAAIAIRNARLIQDRNKILKENISTLTHNTISPLTAINFQLSQLKNGKLPFKIRMRIELIINEIERLSHTLRTYLNFTKSKHRFLDLTLKKKDVCKLVREMVSLYKPEAKHKSISISFSSSENQIYCTLDEELVKNAVSNVIQNAIEAIVESIHDENRKISVKIFEEEKQIKIMVEDRGIGIERNEINKLLKPYYSSKGGTGIGLTIAKRIVEHHNGVLKIESNGINTGTKISINLPIGV